MKIAKIIWKTLALSLGLIFLSWIILACQSMNSVKKDREAVRAFERGEYLYKRGVLNEAIMEFTKAIEVEPDWTQAYIMRGYVHGWNDNNEFSIKDYETAAMLDPNNSDFAQAVRYFHEKDYDRSIELLNRVIQNKVNLMISYNLRGNALAVIGEFEKSIADHAEAIRLNPDFFGNYINRGNTYIYIGQFERAIADCDRAIRINSNGFFGYLVRGVAYHRLENYQKAAEDLTKGIEMSSLSNEQLLREFYLFRGSSYFMLNDYRNALLDMGTVLRLDPGNEHALNLWNEILNILLQ